MFSPVFYTRAFVYLVRLYVKVHINVGVCPNRPPARPPPLRKRFLPTGKLNWAPRPYPPIDNEWQIARRDVNLHIGDLVGRDAQKTTIGTLRGA